MKIITPGHRYELEYFEPIRDSPPQILQFIEKVPKPTCCGQPPTGQMNTVNNGTTNEEVLRVLIDRITVLNENFKSRENSIVITKLEECLMWLEKRTADRKARGVEGKMLP